ncbi:MAG: hypothetical protein MJE77_21525 [Proteobacteria bacterium]|nr:hypothetical protein [Pseudomonadota bacterium]
MNVLIIADPIEQLLPISDTGLLMLREAMKRGHQVHWCTPDDVFLWDGRPQARASRAQHCAPESLPTVDPQPETMLLTAWDTIWIRKDPPFDTRYVDLCWLCSLVEDRVHFVNRPSLLIRHHEKLLPFQAVAQGIISAEELIPTWLCSDLRRPPPDDFPEGPCVTKPWLGYGGTGVKKWDSLQQAVDFFARQKSPEGDRSGQRDAIMFQPLLREVAHVGDRRVFYQDGQVRANFVRLPREGDFVSNLAYGGTAVIRSITDKDRDISQRVGDFLAELGIVIAGLDVIDGRLSEVNITAPTGFQMLVQLGGPELISEYVDMVERQLG